MLRYCNILKILHNPICGFLQYRKYLIDIKVQLLKYKWIIVTDSQLFCVELCVVLKLYIIFPDMSLKTNLNLKLDNWILFSPLFYLLLVMLLQNLD